MAAGPRSRMWLVVWLAGIAVLLVLLAVIGGFKPQVLIVKAVVLVIAAVVGFSLLRRS